MYFFQEVHLLRPDQAGLSEEVCLQVFTPGSQLNVALQGFIG